jgi:ribosomal protein S26
MTRPEKETTRITSARTDGEDTVDDGTARELLAEAAISDAYELRSTMSRLQRDQVAIHHDIVAVRRDLTEGFVTMHTRFAVVHRDLNRMLTLLERLAARHDAA